MTLSMTFQGQASRFWEVCWNCVYQLENGEFQCAKIHQPFKITTQGPRLYIFNSKKMETWNLWVKHGVCFFICFSGYCLLFWRQAITNSFKKNNTIVNPLSPMFDPSLKCPLVFLVINLFHCLSSREFFFKMGKNK